MKKVYLDVPNNVRYISEWNEFDVSLFLGHSIINKFLTGCGFTHYSLTNNIPTILCSPRKFLLENKFEQIPNCHLVVNKGEKILSIDGGEDTTINYSLKEYLNNPQLLTYSNNDDSFQNLSNFEIIKNLKDRLYNYLEFCRSEQRVPKILVTYDSLKHVIEALGVELKNYSIIIDEFQNIFMDASFKADTELNFLYSLQSCPNVTYLSATPYMEEYLDMLDEFKDLPYYELKWDSKKIRTIDVINRKTRSIQKEIDKIIQNYLLNNYPIKVLSDGQVRKSTEVVFYVNNVKMICSAIKRNNLTPDQVNIICANTTKNLSSLRKINSHFSIGTAPLRGEPHKMFTFCTRTTYVGADFYSDNASTVIISDCSIDSLATDIRMDFPQIMGRQRLKENVFRDECIFIYKLADNTITMELFEDLRDKKIATSLEDLKNFEGVVKNNPTGKARFLEFIRQNVKNNRYTSDYTGINETLGIPMINKLVMLSEKRAFELRSDVYKNEVSVYNEFANISEDNIVTNIENQIKYCLDQLKIICSERGSLEEKMREICNVLFMYPDKIFISDLEFLPRDWKNYLISLGPERIKALGYIESNLKKELLVYLSSDLLKKQFRDTFEVGKRYTLKYLKESIGLIYQDNSVPKTPKASDLGDYFNVKKCSIFENGKKVNGYEILSLKE